MKLQVVFASHDCSCGCGKCPTVYKTESGDTVVQGYRLSDEERSTLDIPTGEEMIRLPAEFFEGMLRELKPQ